MTFHGGTRRRSRRAFDTLDAQVNCNRELAERLVVSAKREIDQSTSRRERRERERQVRGEDDETGVGGARPDVICDGW